MTSETAPAAGEGGNRDDSSRSSATSSASKINMDRIKVISEECRRVKCRVREGRETERPGAKRSVFDNSCSGHTAREGYWEEY